MPTPTKIPPPFPVQVLCPHCQKLADRVHRYRDLAMVLHPGRVTGLIAAGQAAPPRTPRHAPAALYLCPWCHALRLRGPHDAPIYEEGV